MNQILIELDADTAAKLEAVAPARSRRRSEFIRSAIRRALWDLEEEATRAAYARQPDGESDERVDPDVWEAKPASSVPASRRRRR